MTALPFSAVVGQDQAKRALMLAALDPRLGGVLLRGDKGSAKTTLARGLAALLPGDAPFVELPLGATEERLVGSLDLAALLTDGRPTFHPGLLAAAHGGVLYVDEINLLADHLVDALLDVAVSGVNRVERDGLSHAHPARFILVGSMNPEEGELRPQLLDRFGLAVDIRAPELVADRTEAVRRQLDADRSATTESFLAEDHRRRDQLTEARSVAAVLSDDLIETASRLALAVGVDGLRGDLMLCRAAAAHAALEGRAGATNDDLRVVAELVLGHRRRRRPFDEPGITPEDLERAWAEADPPLPDTDADAEPEDDQKDDRPAAEADQLDEPDRTVRASRPSDPRRPARSATVTRGGGTENAHADQGRFVREEPYDPERGAIHARSTAIAVARRRASGEDRTTVAPADLRAAQHEQLRGSLVIFVVDASASMGAEHRMTGTKAAVIGLLADAYRRRERVALVTFRDDSADVVLRPTASIEVARARLADLPTGGMTPLAAGLDAATRLVGAAATDRVLDLHVVVLTDGRATSGPGDPVEASRDAARRLAATGTRVMIIDTETGPTRLGLAGRLAEEIGAHHVHLDDLGSELEGTVRAHVAGGRG